MDGSHHHASTAYTSEATYAGTRAPVWAATTLIPDAYTSDEFFAIERERGYATIVDELEEGLASVSTGVFAPVGRLVGVVNVTGLSLRFTPAGERRIVRELRATVSELEAAFSRGDLRV